MTNIKNFEPFTFFFGLCWCIMGLIFTYLGYYYVGILLMIFGAFVGWIGCCKMESIKDISQTNDQQKQNNVKEAQQSIDNVMGEKD